MTTAQDIHQSRRQSSCKVPKNRYQIIVDRTYQSNINSDYTEKIDDLRKAFDYDRDRHDFWGDPELSMFYGTPLYEQASDSQKLALNHLYWVSQYHHTAGSEANTMLYNQVTCGVFEKLGGYGTLCDELTFETSQERHHISTFQKVAYRTKLALLGKDALVKPVNNVISGPTQKNRKKVLRGLPVEEMKPKLDAAQEAAFRSITKLMFKHQAPYYSRFLEQEGGKSIPMTSGGLAGASASPSAIKFLTLNWGSSPFMAAQYYSARMIANISLKAYEHRYYKRFRLLQKRGDFVPVPLAISFYHLLDESYHTTMSQVIAQQVYKDFRPPSYYEVALSNSVIFMIQKGLMGGLSGAMPVVFRHDAPFMAALYRILESPLFGFSQQDAVMWLERCLCEEHEGFHVNRRFHGMLLTDLQRFFGQLDYLWPVNREMRVTAKGASIEEALRVNRAAFQNFTRSLQEP